MMVKQWTRQELLDLAASYRQACVLATAADLGLFDALAAGPTSASQVAQSIHADPRAVATLLDALAALELLNKDDQTYTMPRAVADLLTESGRQSVLPMARHQANCLRRWVQLPWVAKSGRAAERTTSLRGGEQDQAAFIAAMHTVSEQMAPNLVGGIQPLKFSHFLDVGGASGTWTIEFLKTMPDAKATLFDLPVAIPQAKQRIAAAGMTDRVTFVTGDFYVDDLPAGADLAWHGAIVHQNSRRQNRDLFAKVHAALVRGGRIVIRDIIMDQTRTRPVDGALFAINMLVGTPAGGTYTFAELDEDLRASGFAPAKMLHEGQYMDSVIAATKA